MIEADKLEQFENLFAAYHSLTAGAKSRDPKVTALKIGTVLTGLYAATMEVVTRLDKRTVTARAWTGREAGLRFAFAEFHKALPELIV